MDKESRKARGSNPCASGHKDSSLNFDITNGINNLQKRFLIQ